MLNKLQLINFRSHRDSTIEFCAGITGIIGESLSGKTNFVRAVKKICKNKPTVFKKIHSKFVKDDKTTIRMEIDDNQISLNQTAKINNYKFNDQQFRKVGKNVPDVVSNAINLDDINFQLQLDGPFLVLSPPGQIAKTISQIVKTDILERAIQKIRKKSNESQGEIRVLSRDVEDVKIKLDVLEGLDEVEPLIHKKSRLEKQIEDLCQNINDIEQIKEQIDAARGRTARLNQLLDIKPLVKKHDTISLEIESLEEQQLLLNDVLKIRSEATTTMIARNKAAKLYLKKIKSRGKCPTCFAKINKDTIIRIRKEINIII